MSPTTAPTLRELMTHSAGFCYGGGNKVEDAIYKKTKLFESASLREMIDKLAKIP